MKIGPPRTVADGACIICAIGALIAFDRAIGPYDDVSRATYLKMGSLAASIACGCALWSHMRRIAPCRYDFYSRFLPIVVPSVAVLGLIQTVHYLFFLVGLPINADVNHPAAEVAFGDWWLVLLGIAATGTAYALFRAQRLVARQS
jgi:hypothetical protein